MNNHTKKPSKESQLINLALKHCEFFHSPKKTCFARIRIDNYCAVWSLGSSEFSSWLGHLSWKELKQPLNKNILDSVLMSMNAMALYDGACREVHIRVAQIDNKIFIDLCNDTWQVIEVNDSEWKILDHSPVAFTRSGNMKALPIPFANGDINLLKKHVNVSEDKFPLVVAWLLMSLQAGPGAYPIFICQGGAGTGKTTFSRMLRSLVDPSEADMLSKPKTSEMRVVGADNHVLAFDNLSGISSNCSDSLCKMATGSHEVVRELYTTNGSLTISIKKPIILNGIDEIAKRGDLVSRSIKVELKQIPNESRKTEKVVWEEFNQDAPSIFSALLDGLSVGLATVNDVVIDSSTRMADLCQWVAACGQIFDWPQDTFINAYKSSVNSSYVDSLESSMFASAIVGMFEHRIEYRGTPMNLLEAIEPYYGNLNIGAPSKLIKTAKSVMNNLRRYQDALEVMDIYFDISKNRTNQTELHIWKKGFGVSPSDDEWLNEYAST